MQSSSIVYQFIHALIYALLHLFVCLFVACCVVLCCAVLCCAVCAASPLVGRSGQKHVPRWEWDCQYQCLLALDIDNAVPIMENASGQTSLQGAKQQQQSRAVNESSDSNSGGKNWATGKPFCPGGEKAWLVDKKFRLAINHGFSPPGQSGLLGALPLPPRSESEVMMTSHQTSSSVSKHNEPGQPGFILGFLLI